MALVLSLALIFAAWLFVSDGKPKPFVGLAPLAPRVNTSHYFQTGEIIEIETPPPQTPVTIDRRSRGEIVCCEVMQRIFGKPFTAHRPDFLRNPETGQNLELDCFNPELKIAVEYNGRQHYEFPHRFNPTQSHLIAQVRRDDFKRRACDANGVHLITVPYNVPAERIEEYIVQRLPEMPLTCLDE